MLLSDLTPAQLHARLQAGEDLQLVDVREDVEFDFCHLPGSLHLPLGELPRRAAAEVRRHGPVVLVCHHGLRSGQALAYLQQHLGYNNVLNLRGGIDALSLRVDAAVPRY